MRKFILIAFLPLLGFLASAQTVLFFDDFEDGDDNWDVVGYWGITDEVAYSGSNSFTESPDGIYYSGSFGEQTATMNAGVDLSDYLDATVTFQAQVDLEVGFDYMYLEVSTDLGDSWIEVAVYNGEDMFSWEEYSHSLGAFVGNDDVRLRFRFDPDFAYEVDGMYIDDISIEGSDVDASAPVIIYTPLPYYEGSLGEETITATLLDFSGIATTYLYYSIDGGDFISVEGMNTSGTTYEYVFPEIPAGSFIDYYIEAADGYTDPNTSTSDTYNKIAGEHIFYDDGATGTDLAVYAISESGTEFAAVQINLDETTQLVAVIIATYTDNLTYPNDSLEIHIWGDDGGDPGEDLITPFNVWP